MKAILKIECIGDNYDQNLRFWKNITTQLAGKQSHPARVRGLKHKKVKDDHPEGESHPARVRGLKLI